MRIYSPKILNKLKDLRKKGRSIGEISQELNIPKTSIWYHSHDIKILGDFIEEWRAKRGGSAKRSLVFWEKAKMQASELLHGPKREYSIALAMLYWSEGCKKKCEFVNSDGRMVFLFLSLLKKMFGISDEGVRLVIRIFTGMDRAESLAYWSKVLHISKDKFVIYFNDGGKKGRTRYGMCRVIIKKGHYILKLIHSLINQYSEEQKLV